MPSQRNFSTPTNAKAFFEADDTARLVSAIAKACDRVTEIGAGKSDLEAVADYEKRVAEMLIKRSEKRLLETPRKPLGRPTSTVVTPYSGDESEDNETDPSEHAATESDDESSKAGSQEAGSQALVDSFKVVDEIDDDYAKAAYRRLVHAILKIFEAHRKTRRSTIIRMVRVLFVIEDLVKIQLID